MRASKLTGAFPAAVLMMVNSLRVRSGKSVSPAAPAFWAHEVVAGREGAATKVIGRGRTIQFGSRNRVDEHYHYCILTPPGCLRLLRQRQAGRR